MEYHHIVLVTRHVMLFEMFNVYHHHQLIINQQDKNDSNMLDDLHTDEVAQNKENVILEDWKDLTEYL